MKSMFFSANFILYIYKLQFVFLCVLHSSFIRVAMAPTLMTVSGFARAESLRCFVKKRLNKNFTLHSHKLHRTHVKYFAAFFSRAHA